MARGWLRDKAAKRIKLYCYRDADGMERSKSLGPNSISLTPAEAWLKVGERGLDKLVGTSKPDALTFGVLAEKYLAQYPFNKASTKELHEQIVRNVLAPEWEDRVAARIDPPKLKTWMVKLDVESSTRGKYKSVMSSVYNWGQCEGLIPLGEKFNPLNYVKGREFSQVTSYEALALEIEDVFAVLSAFQQPEYEIALVVVACQLRISEALGLRWKNILWDRNMIAIRQTFVHSNIQEGAKTKKSRSRVEAPKLLLDALAAWREETPYAGGDDFVFPSVKLGGKQPRSGSMLVEDYIRPAAIQCGVIREEGGVTYDRDGEVVKRFGFHVLGRHSIATFLMENETNPAVVQAVMRHAKMEMTLYYSHTHRAAKRAAQDKVLQHMVPENLRVPVRGPETVQ